MRSVCRKLPFFFLMLLSACNETIIKGSKNTNFNPNACGDRGISFASVNEKVILRNCTVNGCHAGGSLNFTSFEGVHANAEQIKDSVLKDRMPPAGPLSLQNKELLITWINQGAPLNAEEAVFDCVDMEPEPLLQPTYESLKARVFEQNCLGCHGVGARIGDFSSYDAITSPSVSELFDRERPERSEFVVRLVTDGRGLMPPPRTGMPKLSPEVVEVIKTWIANGMPRE